MAIQQDNPPTKGADAIQGNQSFPATMSEFMALSPEEQTGILSERKETLSSMDRTLVNSTANDNPIQFSIPSEFKDYPSVQEFSTAVLNNATYGDIWEQQQKTGEPALLMTKDEFMFNYSEQLSKSGQDPEKLYSGIEEMYLGYNSMKKANLPLSYNALPPTGYLKKLLGSDEDLKSRLATKRLTDNKLHVGSNSAELYHEDVNTNARNFYLEKDGETMIPLSLKKYKDANPLKRVFDDNGSSYWQEAQDGEMIPADMIRTATQRRLKSTSHLNSFFRGGVYAMGMVAHGSLNTIPFAFRAALDFSDTPLYEKEFYKNYVKQDNALKQHLKRIPMKQQGHLIIA